jgi:hypothetical protein
MDIIIEKLLGWDRNKKAANKKWNIWKVCGYSDATEEQMQKNLHGYMMIYDQDT